MLTEVMNDEAMEAARADFLAVLDATEEPPGITAPPANPMMRGWLSSFQEVLPSGAMDLFEQLMQQQQAQMHRMQAMHGGTFTGITPPASLSAAHGMAVAQLRSLGQQLDEAGLELLTAQLVARGVPKAELLMAMPADDRNAFAPSPEVAEDFPDDIDLLAVQLVVNGFGEGDLERERVERAIEVFDTDHEVLAMMARLGLFTRLQAEGSPEEETDAVWEPIAAQLAAMDEAPDMVIAMLAQQLLGARGGQAMTGTLDEERQAFLIDRLRGWYVGLDATSQMKPMVLMMLTGVLAEAEDWAGLGRLLTDETLALGAGKAAPNAQQRQMAMMMGAGRVSSSRCPSRRPASPACRRR